MITFCTGSTTIKRRYFRSMGGEGIVSVDNDEIIATFSLDKRLYAVTGEIPYSNMTLEQYIACSRALVTRLPITRSAIKDMMGRAGLKASPKKRLKRLSRVEYRAASLVTKIGTDTKTIFVNFDGLEYNAKNRRLLTRFLLVWGKTYEVFAAVSDTRFIPNRAPVLCYTAEGIKQDKTKSKSRVIAKSSLKRRLKSGGMDIALPAIKKVVAVSN